MLWRSLLFIQESRTDVEDDEEELVKGKTQEEEMEMEENEEQEDQNSSNSPFFRLLIVAPDDEIMRYRYLLQKFRMLLLATKIPYSLLLYMFNYFAFKVQICCQKSYIIISFKVC